MQFYQILVWFKRNLKDIILSQRKTIAYLVYGIMISKKAGVAAITRGIYHEKVQFRGRRFGCVNRLRASLGADGLDGGRHQSRRVRFRTLCV